MTHGGTMSAAPDHSARTSHTSGTPTDAPDTSATAATAATAPTLAGAGKPHEAAPVAPGSRTTDVALIATFAALTAVCSLLAVRVGASSVPITLQTFAVLLAGAVLGARRGTLAVLLFLAVGFAGLPIFAEGVGGLGTFGRASIGYLLAFPLAALVMGVVVDRFGRRGWALRTGVLVGAGVVATLLVYAVGVPVMAARLGVTLGEAVGYNNVYIPFDLVKVVLAAVVASAVHRAFPDLLRRR